MQQKLKHGKSDQRCFYFLCSAVTPPGGGAAKERKAHQQHPLSFHRSNLSNLSQTVIYPVSGASDLTHSPVPTGIENGAEPPVPPQTSWKCVYFHSKHLMRQDQWSINFNFIDLINVCCTVDPPSCRLAPPVSSAVLGVESERVCQIEPFLEVPFIRPAELWLVPSVPSQAKPSSPIEATFVQATDCTPPHRTAFCSN